MSAAEAFVPLADLLRPPAVCEPAVLEPHAEPVVVLAHAPAEAAPVAPETIAAIREARRFQARLADALDARLERLLAAIASEILMRELRSAPAGLASLVARVVGEHAATPLCVRVAAADRDVLGAYDVPVVVDAALDAGDAVIVFGAGEIDARLGVRVAAVLEALR